jgi:hypothetical protein
MAPVAMNSSPEELNARLVAIEATLTKLHVDNAHLLQEFEEINARYRKEVDEYANERTARRLGVRIGEVLRVVAVVLLAYIALKLS